MKIFLKDLFLAFFVSLFASAIIAGAGNLLFEFKFENRVYPGIKIDNINFGNTTPQEISNYFSREPDLPDTVNWYFEDATFSAKVADFSIKYDVFLMTDRALSVGRQTGNLYYDFLQKLSAAAGNINLPVEITTDEGAIDRFLTEISPKVESPAVDGQFKFEPGTGPDGKGRVVAFDQSKNGIEIDRDKFREQLISLVGNKKTDFILPTKVITPRVTSEEVNKLGIKDLLGTGVSYFYDSIPGRVANIKVGTEKISGSLIAPGEVFSFDEAIGTVSAIFGFSKAYVIKENKTVLEDGGGVCQVSTTLYRAAINAGLPVLERVAHSYRVPFYEQGGFKPGMDATVYPPSPDFKFRNDTPSWILIQAHFDDKSSKLTFDIFGASDGRTTEISGPVILSVSPPPAPIYEDQPDKPVGFIQQVDTAHWGAETYFIRKVTRDGTELINETVKTSYIPWPARYLRGTKS